MKSKLWIIGDGPSALHTALWANECGISTNLLTNNRSYTNTQNPRVECTPVQACGILSTVGMDCSKLGIDKVLTERKVAWKSNRPVTIKVMPYVNIERPSLEFELLKTVELKKNINIIQNDSANIESFIDARGSAGYMEFKNDAWFAKVLSLRSRSNFDPRFSIASLPNGYVYKVASKNWINFVFVAPIQEINIDIREIELCVHQSGQSWILEDLPSLHKFTQSRGGLTNFMYSKKKGRKIGAAALNRDILSSQGLISSLSDGYYAVKSFLNNNWQQLESRHTLEKELHLKSIISALENNLHSDKEVWVKYKEYIESNISESV